MNSTADDNILAVDPGRDKCGVAVVDGSGAGKLAVIVPTREIVDKIEDLMGRFSAKTLVLGSGTDAGRVAQALKNAGFEPILVQEAFTTREARQLYFRDHPPRGLRRLIPRGLLSPPRPVDDYAALRIALRFIQNSKERRIDS